MNKKISAIVVLVLAVAAGWYIVSGHKVGSTAAVAGANDTVATVNGTSITRGQLVAAESQIAAQQGVATTSATVLAQVQSVALDSLIGQDLLLQTAQKAGITASSSEVAAQLAAIKTQAGSDANYQKALAAQGITESDLLVRIGNRIMVNTLLNQQLNLSAITASDAEVLALYKQAVQQSGTSTPPLAQVRAQVVQMVVQQKQQTAVNAYVAQLRSAANVQVLIATSTPAA